jgi:hypothetical protein
MTQNVRKSISPRSKEWVTAALLVIAMGLGWISWRAGSPALERFRYEATRHAAMLSKLQLPGTASKGGPEQRIGMP